MNAALHCHNRQAILEKARFPKIAGTTSRSMRQVLEALAARTVRDGLQSKFRPLDELRIAKSIGTARRVVTKAIIALESLRVITRMRSGGQMTVCINWYTLADFVPSPSFSRSEP
ncbi:hypothetical protein [Bremerella cremea]|uniref:hypothetical protein n=1 Tax=Bremerella cremea TaxID=1031537 RepID=UPI0031EB1A25